MIPFLSANLLGIAVGYSLCVLVPIPGVEAFIRGWWFRFWSWAWKNTLGRLIPDAG